MTVVNKRTHTPTPNDVYIGRGSLWGNPFKIGNTPDATREAVITWYRRRMEYNLNESPNKDKWHEELMKLKGKTLVCFCKPYACHGDILEQLIEESQATSSYLNKPLRTQEKANEDISNHNKS